MKVCNRELLYLSFKELLNTHKVFDFTVASGSGVYIWWPNQKSGDVSLNFFVYFKSIHDSSFSQSKVIVEGSFSQTPSPSPTSPPKKIDPESPTRTVLIKKKILNWSQVNIQNSLNKWPWSVERTIHFSETEKMKLTFL